MGSTYQQLRSFGEPPPPPSSIRGTVPHVPRLLFAPCPARVPVTCRKRPALATSPSVSPFGCCRWPAPRWATGPPAPALPSHCTEGSPPLLLGFALHDGTHAGGSVPPEFARLIPQTELSRSFFNSFNLYLHLEAKTFSSEVAC